MNNIVDKSALDFYKDKSRPDGISSRCKICDKQKQEQLQRLGRLLQP
jgi:hypothetical protein